MVGADAVEGNLEDALRKVDSDSVDDGVSIGLGSRTGEASDGEIESDCPSSSFLATNSRLIDELVGWGVNHGCARI